ncbi:MAG: hypothetical protein IT186_08925 [Acidobacteria bacterium]|nr:hypothetical protein [Acidobacteriota bacterium]
MNTDHMNSLVNSNPVRPILTSVDVPGRNSMRCATPHCQNLVLDPWEPSGTLCASCAIESDLADRPARWDRLCSAIQ